MKPYTDKKTLLIVGGGCTGLYLAYRLLNMVSSEEINIVMIESRDRTGGRIHTYHFKDKEDGRMIQYDSGGARFSDQHKRLVALLKELGLYKDKLPIPSGSSFMTIHPNKYNHILHNKDLNYHIHQISQHVKTCQLTKAYLKSTTLYLLLKTNKDFVNHFGKGYYKFIGDLFEYWSEYAVMNAYDALELLRHEFNTNIQYYVLKKGYQSITNALERQCKSFKNFKLMLQETCQTIGIGDDKAVICECEHSKTKKKRP